MLPTVGVLLSVSTQVPTNSAVPVEAVATAAVQVKIVNGVKYYSIQLVGFNKREKVESLIVELKKKFPDSFVVDFSK
jgi:hypothetical protein